MLGLASCLVCALVAVSCSEGKLAPLAALSVAVSPSLLAANAGLRLRRAVASSRMSRSCPCTERRRLVPGVGLSYGASPLQRDPQAATSCVAIRCAPPAALVGNGRPAFHFAIEKTMAVFVGRVTKPFLTPKRLKEKPPPLECGSACAGGCANAPCAGGCANTPCADRCTKGPYARSQQLRSARCARNPRVVIMLRRPPPPARRVVACDKGCAANKPCTTPEPPVERVEPVEPVRVEPEPVEEPMPTPCPCRVPKEEVEEPKAKPCPCLSPTNHVEDATPRPCPCQTPKEQVVEPRKRPCPCQSPKEEVVEPRERRCPCLESRGRDGTSRRCPCLDPVERDSGSQRERFKKEIKMVVAESVV